MKELANLTAVVVSALREYARMYDGFDHDVKIFDHERDDTYVDLNYRGEVYRIEVKGPFPLTCTEGE